MIPDDTLLQPTRLELNPAGCPFSSRYGDVYASRDGAGAQARHVFLAGNDLPARWADARRFVIVELGFGLGVNFLATWQAWRDDARRPHRLHFVSIEKHPLPAEEMARAAPPEYSALAAELAARWPLPLPGMHRIEFDGGLVVLTLAFGDARVLCQRLVAGADAFYLDGFAPARNPQMWTAALLKSLARLARPGATLATWSVASAVRDALVASGFDVNLREGFGHKREMLTARFAPRWKVRRHEPPAPYEGERRALIVGAGLAGCATAYALAKRGWQVTLIEREAEPASAASALPAGLLHPQLAADDNVLVRLTRAGFLSSLNLLSALTKDEVSWWRAPGMFQQVPDARRAAALRAWLDRAGWPPQYAQWRRAVEVARDIGLQPRHDGVWFGRAAVVSAPHWCRAMLAACGDLVDVRCGASAMRIERAGAQWRVMTATDSYLAPVVVVASSLDAPQLLGSRNLYVRAVGGRIALVSLDAQLLAASAGDGYVAPSLFGGVVAGATYEADAPDAESASAQESNLGRLRRLFAEAPSAKLNTGFAAARCVARDRLPFAGAVVDEQAVPRNGGHLIDLPRRSGLFCLFALASRGLTLAPLLAEHVAAQIEGEPSPIEIDLAAAVDPGRYVLRSLRAIQESSRAIP